MEKLTQLEEDQIKDWAQELRSRWAILVLLDRDELEELHRRERLRVKSSKLSCQNRADLDNATIETLVVRHRLRPFWPKELEDTTKSERLFAFYCQIFPIWVPIVRRRFIEYNKQIEIDKFAKFNEVDLVHACDLAIYNSKISPDRAAGFSVAQQARRDSVVGKASRVG